MLKGNTKLPTWLCYLIVSSIIIKSKTIYINVHQIICQHKKIRYKPNLHVRDFSRWPLFDISNIFINFVQHVYWYEYCYSFYQMFIPITYLLQLLWRFEVFYRNPTSVIFKMAAVPTNFNFQIESIAKNVLHDIYY